MNLILLMHESSNLSDMRCNMLRCISNLSVIQEISEYEDLKFDKVRIFDNFMSCFKNREKFIYQCETCTKEQENELGEQNKKNVFLCRSCMTRKSCHPIDHQFKKLDIKDFKVKGIKCGCLCN